jgi:hypothetical protein
MDRILATGGADRRVKLWDLTKGKDEELKFSMLMITWLLCTLRFVHGTLWLHNVSTVQNPRWSDLHTVCVCMQHMPFFFFKLSFRLDMVYAWLVSHDFLSQTIIFLCFIVDQKASASIYMSSDLHVHFVESCHAVDHIINWANIICLHCQHCLFS